MNIEVKDKELENVNGGVIPTTVGYYGKYSIFKTTGSSGGYNGPYQTMEEAEIGVVDYIVNTLFLEYIDSTYATYCIMQKTEDGSLVKVKAQTRVNK